MMNRLTTIQRLSTLLYSGKKMISSLFVGASVLSIKRIRYGKIYRIEERLRHFFFQIWSREFHKIISWSNEVLFHLFRGADIISARSRLGNKQQTSQSKPEMSDVALSGLFARRAFMAQIFDQQSTFDVGKGTSLIENE